MCWGCVVANDTEIFQKKELCFEEEKPFLQANMKQSIKKLKSKTQMDNDPKHLKIHQNHLMRHKVKVLQ